MNSKFSDLSRRAFLKTAAALPVAASLPSLDEALPAETQEKRIGEWSDDAAGLPCYRYLGPLPFVSPSSRIRAEYLPEDPFFLLGNYRLTLIVHVSGQYQILSGERAWGRLNQGAKPWSGRNDAAVEAAGKRVELVGLHAAAAQAAEKLVGVGYAQYRYAPLPDLKVTRTLSVLPSTKLNEGTSAFLVSVRMENTGTEAMEAAYSENVGAEYAQIIAEWDADQKLVSYSSQAVRAAEHVRCMTQAKEPRPLLFSRGGRMSRFEGAPPSLFVRPIPQPDEARPTLTVEKDSDSVIRLGIRAERKLAARGQSVFHFLVGYVFAETEIDLLAARITAAMGDAGEPYFQQEWNRVVPSLKDEPDLDLRREMRWNAAVLEEMATWREYYDETVIPQGMIYDYQWGMMASSRDLAQQALPSCHTNPALARSTLRFIMKRTLPDGEIKLDDLGFGWCPHGARLTSDQQLYFFLLLIEYMRVTGDQTILTERISYYPAENGGQGTGLEHVRDAFLFLRDRIGTGRHGLMKLWNSDWNDMFFYWPTTAPYNYTFERSESHMNTAMAVVILGDLAATLEKLDLEKLGLADSAELAGAVRQHREGLRKAFMEDWDTRPFPRRMYFQRGQPVGEEEMWLEPQGFTLLIPELPVERKRALYHQIQERLLKGEAMGAKQIERPIQKLETPAGSREDGGFWYALNGPLVLGVAGFAPEEAQKLLRRMTFANYRRHFPNYWTGHWTASDALDSASLPTEGLSLYIPCCAHAHAWPLYLYLRLREGDGTAGQQPHPLA
jgi:cellobiose phosphorylase